MMGFGPEVRKEHVLNPDYKFRGHVYQHGASW